MNRNVIAIDGPAGSGKTTLAVRLADRLGAVYLDTGLLYRAATVLAFDAGLTTDDGEQIAGAITSGSIQVRPPSVRDGRPSDVLLNGEDVTSRLRAQEVDANVSAYSAIPAVRAAMLPLQRSFAEHQRVVMVGRDIATVVFPNAAVRFYLDASLAERARRRWRDLVIDHPDLTIAEVEADLARRDGIDSTRELAPLEIAAGSTIVDSDGKSIEQVTDEIAAIARQAWGIR